jgi:hypothetical protein
MAISTSGIKPSILRRSITSHVYEQDLLALFPDSTVNYKRVADIADLSKSDLGKLGKVAKSSVRFDEKIPQPVADRLREIGNIANLVAEYFQGDAQKVELWFRLPNPMLGNISPRDMIRLGRYERLLNFVLDTHQAEQSAKVSPK